MQTMRKNLLNVLYFTKLNLVPNISNIEQLVETNRKNDDHLQTMEKIEEAFQDNKKDIILDPEQQEKPEAEARVEKREEEPLEEKEEENIEEKAIERLEESLDDIIEQQNNSKTDKINIIVIIKL